MPELPEVETTRRGIAPALRGQTVTAVVVRQAQLRLPVPAHLARTLPGQRLLAVGRRAKYLLLRAETGTLIVHLGMSGSLRITTAEPPGPHDHLDIEFAGGQCLRLRDPRRFGLVIWTGGDPLAHPLLRHLGPEPLWRAFDGAYLHARARRRRIAIKAWLMDGRVVAGLGNIYTSEALYRAGIHPLRPAGRISLRRFDALTAAIKALLHDALRAGGTTLRDFHGADGHPGYFRFSLRVYGRAGQACRRCGGEIRRRTLAQRSTFYCPGCQH